MAVLISNFYVIFALHYPEVPTKFNFPELTKKLWVSEGTAVERNTEKTTKILGYILSNAVSWKTMKIFGISS